MSVVYDAGALIAADRDDRERWADHALELRSGRAPLTTSPALAQVSRSGRQSRLRLFLRGCDIVAFTAQDGHEVGRLLARAGTSDVVDAHVALTAARHRAAVVTSDPDDLSRLVTAGGLDVDILAI